MIKQLDGDDSIDYFTFTAESGKNLLNVASMSGGQDPTQKQIYATFEGDNSVYTWQGELRIIYDIENRNFTPYLVVQNAAFLSGSLTGKLSTGVNASFGFDLTDSVVWN